MNKITSITTTLLFAGLVNAQVIDQWNLADADGTALSAATNSVGSTLWNTSATGTTPLIQSGELNILTDTSSVQYADIFDLVSGEYLFTLTGVTFSGISGGLDDYISFGFTEDTGSGNARSFSVIGSNSRDKAMLVVGNENNTGGLDALGFSHGTTTSIQNDLTASFAGTYDFQIHLDATNKTVDFFYQVNAGGYNQIGSQLSYIDTDNTGLLYFSHSMSNSGGGDSATVGGLEFAAIPEPSTLLLMGVALVSLAIFRRRK